MNKLPSGVGSNRAYCGLSPITAALASLLVLWSGATVSAQPALTNFAQISSPAAAGALVWGDADRDDDLDLWITGSRYETSTYRSTVLRNDRNGVLSPSLGELTQLIRGDAAWTDFDRDGDLDAVMSGYTSSPSASTAVYRNDLPSAFTSVVVINRLPSLGDSALACADADGDGDQDVLICGTGSSARQAALYLNLGSGSYSNSLLVLPPVSEGAVAWADFDGDGDQDFVLTGSTNGAVSGAMSLLYRNQGSAGFAQVPTSLPAVYRSSVAWADFDCDGDPDLLIAGVSATGPVTVLFRNDNGTLTPGPAFPGVADGALAWGDADQDGYPDLALSGRLSSGSGSLFAAFYWNRAGVFTNGLLPDQHRWLIFTLLALRCPKSAPNTVDLLAIQADAVPKSVHQLHRGPRQCAVIPVIVVHAFPIRPFVSIFRVRRTTIVGNAVVSLQYRPRKEEQTVLPIQL